MIDSAKRSVPTGRSLRDLGKCGHKSRRYQRKKKLVYRSSFLNALKNHARQKEAPLITGAEGARGGGNEEIRHSVWGQ